MAFKILTGKGVENTNIDAARQQFFIAGMRDGIFKGALNELEFSPLTSSGISLDTGVLSIGGHLVINNEMLTQTITTSLAEDTRYSLIAQLVVDDNSNASFSLIIQNVSIPLVKNNMFSTEIGAGTYQVEIGRFTVTTLGTVTDVSRTLDVITGGSGGASEHFVLGTITTITLDAGMDANLTGEDIYDANGNYIQTNFVLEIPATAGTVVTVDGIEQANIGFESDPQTQLNSKVNKSDIDSALSSTSENPVQNKVVKDALDAKANTSTLDDYVTKTTTQEVSGAKTFTGDNTYKTSGATYGAKIPDTTGWITNKTLATTDQIMTPSDTVIVDTSIPVTSTNLFTAPANGVAYLRYSLTGTPGGALGIHLRSTNNVDLAYNTQKLQSNTGNGMIYNATFVMKKGQKLFCYENSLTVDWGQISFVQSDGQ